MYVLGVDADDKGSGGPLSAGGSSDPEVCVRARAFDRGTHSIKAQSTLKAQSTHTSQEYRRCGSVFVCVCVRARTAKTLTNVCPDEFAHACAYRVQLRLGTRWELSHSHA